VPKILSDVGFTPYNGRLRYCVVLLEEQDDQVMLRTDSKRLSLNYCNFLRSKDRIAFVRDEIDNRILN